MQRLFPHIPVDQPDIQRLYDMQRLFQQIPVDQYDMQRLFRHIPVDQYDMQRLFRYIPVGQHDMQKLFRHIPIDQQMPVQMLGDKCGWRHDYNYFTIRKHVSQPDINIEGTCRPCAGYTTKC